MSEVYQNPTDPERTNGIDHLTDRAGVGYLETAAGDLIFGADEDILKANITESISQRLIAFIHTKKGSVSLWPYFGSRVHELFGKSSSNADVFEQARVDLVQDLRSNGFSPIEDEIEVLPYSPSVIMIRVTIEDSSPELSTTTIEQTYQMQSDQSLIEFLGGRSY